MEQRQIQETEKQRAAQSEASRQQYFQAQRQQIDDFKMFKEQTEGLLMIKKNNAVRNPSQAMIKEYHKNIKTSLSGAAD